MNCTEACGRLTGALVVRRLVAIGLLATVATACGSAAGPSTMAELCDSYDALSGEIGEFNGLFDNAIFSAAGDLGHVAQRYEDDSSVQASGEQLVQISDSDETSSYELSTAAVEVQAECGAPPLGLMFGQ